MRFTSPAACVTRMAALAVALVLGGCAQLSYYSQSVRGELSLLSRRQPIAELVSDPGTPPALRRRLERARRMRRFAVHDLHLPDNGSFTTYADVGRPFVTWNVFAAPRFSLDLKTWCFPVAGCVRYRGYFHKEAAEQEARRLRAAGDDVYVGGVPAYSTLGWFADPLLSTVVDWPSFELAGLIFHELAHQEVYLAGDTQFNESFAVTVQREGVRRWLAARGTPRQRQRYQDYRRRRRAFVALVMGARRRLQALYGQSLPPTVMGQHKAAIVAGLRRRYRDLKQRWDGYDGYDHWFSGPLNNAQIGSVVTYEQYVPAFQALLARHHGDLPAFYRAVAALARLPEKARHRRLADLAARAPEPAAGPLPGASPAAAAQ